MGLSHTWSVVDPEEANSSLEEENIRKDIWKDDTLEEVASKMGY